MALPKPVRAPTNASVPDTLRVPSTAKSLLKSLLRLSKPSLIELVLQWLQDENQTTCAPYLTSNRSPEEEVDEDYLWSPADSLEELRLVYNRMRFDNNITKRYIIGRVLDGDWRRGLSLYQVATIDFQCLSDNDKTLRWTALKLVPQLDEDANDGEPIRKKRKMNLEPYPSTLPATLVRNLQRQISPLVKAHYSFQQIPGLSNLPVVRVCVADSPYAKPHSSTQPPLLFTDPGRLIFIALPDSCPYLYISVSGAAKGSASGGKPWSARMDTTSLKRVVLEQIPKALSQPGQRYSLESTSLTARSLATMLMLRGNSGTNAANGIYTIFSKGVVDNSPIEAANASFAQKIFQACQGGEKHESDLSLSELSLKPQRQTEKRGARIEKGSNLPPTQETNPEEEDVDLKVAAAERFGVTGLQCAEPASAKQEGAAVTDALDRVQMRLDENLFSIGTPSDVSEEDDTPNDVHPADQSGPGTSSHVVQQQISARMTLTFQGTNVFLGLRQLVESGLIQPGNMPAWMTGEEAISGGTVRQGFVVRGKGVGA